MFTFNANVRSGPFSDPKTEQIKQAVRQARASNSHTVKVSKGWFNTMKPILIGLAHPSPIGADSANVLGVAIKVDESIKNDNEFEVA